MAHCVLQAEKVSASLSAHTITLLLWVAVQKLYIVVLVGIELFNDKTSKSSYNCQDIGSSRQWS